MLVLSRKAGEAIHIGDNVVIRVTRVQGNRVTIGIDAPPEVSIHRGELLRLIAGDASLPARSAEVMSSCDRKAIAG